MGAIPVVDVDAIEARAAVVPDVRYEAGIDRMWAGFTVPDDEEGDGTPCSSGRWVAEDPQYWHSGSEGLPPGFWEFHAAARADVLALAAEVRRLRSTLAGQLASPSLKAAA